MPSSACDWSSDVCSSDRSEEHTSELQSRSDLVCRLLLEKKKKKARVHGNPLRRHHATQAVAVAGESMLRESYPPALHRRTPRHDAIHATTSARGASRC